jgi:hypothetical protein
MIEINDTQLKNYFTKKIDKDIALVLLPKNQNALTIAKEFVLNAMDSGVKQIIKIGSLGPWRLMHSQFDSFIKESSIPYTSFDIAPLMSHIFIEQYKDKVLYDYRHNAPAPYLDPRCLVQAIEQAAGNKVHYNKNYKCTGTEQYTITDIKSVLDRTNNPVEKIENTHNNKIHKMTADNQDFTMMSRLADNYKKGWYPQITTDLQANFGLSSRTFEQFVLQDQDIYSISHDADRYL